MHYTIEQLIGGDPRLLEDYRKAADHWQEIYSQVDPLGVDTLAERLQAEQMWFGAQLRGKVAGARGYGHQRDRSALYHTIRL
jgi:CHASE3 domain sensor protein